MDLDWHRHAELSSIASCFSWWRFGATFWHPCPIYPFPLLFLGVFFSALSELSSVVSYSSSSAVRFLSSTKNRCIWSDILVLSSSGVLEMHSAKAPRSNFLTAHPLDFSRGRSRFRLCNSKQTCQWSLSDSSSNIIHSHRGLLRVYRRKVRSSTDDDALLSNVAIPSSLITT